MIEYPYREHKDLLTPHCNFEIVDPLQPLESLKGLSIAEARYQYYSGTNWLIPQPHQVDAINEMLQQNGRVDREQLPPSLPYDYNDYLDGYENIDEPHTMTGIASVNGRPIFTARIGNEKYNLWQEQGGFYIYNSYENRLENLGQTPHGKFLQSKLPSEFLDLSRYVPLTTTSGNKYQDAIHRMFGESLTIASLPTVLSHIPRYGTIMESGMKPVDQIYQNYGDYNSLHTLPTLSLHPNGELKQEAVIVLRVNMEQYISIQSTRLANFKEDAKALGL